MCKYHQCIQIRSLIHEVEKGLKQNNHRLDIGKLLLHIVAYWKNILREAVRIVFGEFGT